eukprot:g19333.t1
MIIPFPHFSVHLVLTPVSITYIQRPAFRPGLPGPPTDAKNKEKLQSFQYPFCGKKGWSLPPTSGTRDIYRIEEVITPALQIFYRMKTVQPKECGEVTGSNRRRRNMAVTNGDVIACSFCYRFIETEYGYMPLGYNASTPAGPRPDGLGAKWNVPTDIIFPYWVPVHLSNSAAGGKRQPNCPSKHTQEDAKVFVQEEQFHFVCQ